MKESEQSLKENQHNIGSFTLKLLVSTKHLLWLNCYIFADFVIWLLGYRIEFFVAILWVILPAKKLIMSKIKKSQLLPKYKCKVWKYISVWLNTGVL